MVSKVSATATTRLSSAISSPASPHGYPSSWLRQQLQIRK